MLTPFYLQLIFEFIPDIYRSIDVRKYENEKQYFCHLGFHLPIYSLILLYIHVGLFTYYFCRLGNYEEAHKYFQEAWDRCESEKEQDLQYYSAISVTIKYNTSRLHEMFCQYDKAEKLYKEILQDHPNYVDCKFMIKFPFYHFYLECSKLLIPRGMSHAWYFSKLNWQNMFNYT